MPAIGALAGGTYVSTRISLKFMEQRGCTDVNSPQNPAQIKQCCVSKMEGGLQGCRSEHQARKMAGVGDLGFKTQNEGGKMPSSFSRSLARGVFTARAPSVDERGARNSVGEGCILGKFVFSLPH